MSFDTFNHILLSLVAIYIVATCLLAGVATAVGLIVTFCKKLRRPKSACPAWKPTYVRERQAGPWHAKFCWLPARLDDDRWVWLRWVCRARFSWSSPYQDHTRRLWRKVEIAS